MNSSPDKRDVPRRLGVCHRFPDGALAELVLKENKKQTAFAVFRDGTVTEEATLLLPDNEKISPIPATNNLIKHRALLLPERAEPYASLPTLLEEIAVYLYRYVDLSPDFQRLAAYYALLTWVYDAFNELPYLRLRGDFGSGKTRALTVIGEICFRPFFASGASTVSPIFHTLDTFQGTLVLDEADFRFTDEKSELVKIFNNGNVRGFPVLRTAITTKREFDPRAFAVFGPKVVAMRDAFEDQALESRFLTEEMGQRQLRTDIPINLPGSQKDEALALRNKLLMYRFQTLPEARIKNALVDRTLSPRLNQILVPLLSIIEESPLQRDIREAVRRHEEALYSERATTLEAAVLEALLALFADKGQSSVRVGEIASVVIRKHGNDFSRPVTNRLIGEVLRRRLRLITTKSHGVYVVPVTERSKADELARRYGLQTEHSERVDASE